MSRRLPTTMTILCTTKTFNSGCVQEIGTSTSNCPTGTTIPSTTAEYMRGADEKERARAEMFA
ncbi:hypothetical protein [Nocardia sp. NPDC057455]|uniref:hypothetical protein n=1 Tax=Nocardia sp. NPDC057455 TaxID=3346138 RepID=UPI0036708A0E